MKAEPQSKMWQSPGWSPPEAIPFLHGLVDGGNALVSWPYSSADARWCQWLVAHGLAPFTWRQLKAQQAVDALPVSLREGLRGAYYSAVADAELHTVELRNVLNCLAAAGVTPVLFKGAALAYSVYPDPACRPMGDLDLWVTEEAMPIAQQALAEAGYREHVKSERPADMQRRMQGERPLLGAGPGQGLVELHWGTFPGEWLRRTAAVDEAAVRCRARTIQAAGCDAWTLCPEDAIIQLAVHLAVSHQMAYPGLRGLLDLALLARVEDIDWHALAERAIAWRVKTATWLVLDLTAELLGLPGSEGAVSALAPTQQRQRLLRWFVDGQAMLEGRDMTSGPRRLAYQLALVDRTRNTVRLVARTLWPETSWLIARYGHGGPASRGRHLVRALLGKV